VYRLLLLLIIIFCVACNGAPEPPLEYGEKYFEIDCVWVDPDSIAQAPIWRCFEFVETDLIKGFLYLELENANSLYFCGENLTLATGINIYDNLIRVLTEDKYDCLHITEDKEKGNEFDWSWYPQKRLLQFIWRPDDVPHKMMSLLVEEGDYNEVKRSVVYYKILSSN
tara:strand:- start:1556 stop:2059 length:504 start_codon:yes stop_codon:yes gene_type:complete